MNTKYTVMPRPNEVALQEPFKSKYKHGTLDDLHNIIMLYGDHEIPTLMDYNRYLASVKAGRILTFAEYEKIISESENPSKRYLIMEVGDAMILAYAARHTTENQSTQLNKVIKRVYDDVGADIQSLATALLTRGQWTDELTDKQIGEKLQAIIDRANNRNNSVKEST